ncbi:VanZ family protein [Candidatus Parcubacteria bacterium]|nr:VanZ family protein [Patescibacteria group bacterium]MBU4309089.1 VanZ family protein [Patescibacteria group bacterium]MBU4432466.1 VanZ family protein [Patescibacteria group bacterium]MBU4577450.1 VanZ family protein [Patescibacteria group bacterium]MCG2697138.1 VanZ family protein [Candidatus Parcubacteria bacterium]
MKKHLLIIWTIFVFLLLTIPMAPITSDIVDNYIGIDKIAHFLMFGVFSFLLIYAFIDEYKNRVIYFISIALGFLYAALGEVVQSFLPTRSVSLYDFYAGATGSLFFVIYFYARTRKA